ncbi:hypothetical protein EVAR_37926_1 [Eumeta japonica]|uniref:Uncharacterized protein n=1 Tax=Eumeta variegata TaxID=151549 RepID=A0A4C1XGR2_EUMVA|nr:hypothetical protein EVAR_37926_1 [Eumeta japonica]
MKSVTPAIIGGTKHAGARVRACAGADAEVERVWGRAAACTEGGGRYGAPAGRRRLPAAGPAALRHWRARTAPG